MLITSLRTYNSDSLNESLCEEYMQNTNYTDYEAFCFITNISIFVQRLLNNNEISVVLDVNSDGVVYVKIIDTSNREIALSQKDKSTIQERIIEENKRRLETCLLFTSYNNQIEGVSSAWVMNMLPLVDVPNRYFDSMKIEDEHIYLYMNFSSSKDYEYDYNETLQFVVNELQRMRDEYYMIGMESIEKSWNLERVSQRDETMLSYYKPSWVYTFIAKDTHKLLKHVLDNTGQIFIDIDNFGSYVKRFFVASYLNDMNKTYFFGRNRIYVNNVHTYKEAARIARDIHMEASKDASIVYFRNSLLAKAQDYLQLMIQNYNLNTFNYKPIVYEDEHKESPFVTIGLRYPDDDFTEAQKMIL